MSPRQVTVYRFEVLEFRRVGKLIDADVVVECSSGTYVRALARDLGGPLGVGGHLTALRRTRVGGFRLCDALSLEQLAEREEPVPVELSDAVSAQFPRRELDDVQVAKLRHGVAVPAAGISGPYGAFDPEGRVIALLNEPPDRPENARPLIVFSAA